MGDWEANNPLTLIFRDSNTQSSWVCHVVLTDKSPLIREAAFRADA